MVQRDLSYRQIRRDSKTEQHNIQIPWQPTAFPKAPQSELMAIASKCTSATIHVKERPKHEQQPVYVSFASPHWLCRAGDFRTIEEASEILRQIREMGIFREAVLVKSKIKVRL